MLFLDFRSCKLILEEQNLQYALDAEGENQMNECRKLQVVTLSKTRCSVLSCKSFLLLLKSRRGSQRADAKWEESWANLVYSNVTDRPQVLRSDWMEACMILLAGLGNSPGASPSSGAPVCPVSPAADMETAVSHLSINTIEPGDICHLDVAFYDRCLCRWAKRVQRGRQQTASLKMRLTQIYRR